MTSLLAPPIIEPAVIDPVKYQGLVHWVAKQYRDRGLTHDELVSAGQIGLLRACQRYDPERGQARFMTYAVKAIRGHIRREFGQNGIIRLPEISSRSPAKDEKTVELRRYLQLFRRQARRVYSLSDLKSLPEIVREQALIDFRSLPESRCQKEDRNRDRLMRQKAIEDALSSLTVRQAEVVRLRFGIGYDHPCTLQEIGDIYHVTKERARQILAEAMRRLRRTEWKILLGQFIEPEVVTDLKAPVKIKKSVWRSPRKNSDAVWVQQLIDYYDREYPRVGTVVDGREVLDFIPKLNSTETSMTYYKELPGIREIPTYGFGGVETFSLASDRDHVYGLAKEIRYGKEIYPLIVGIDRKGIYIIKGVDWMAALVELGIRFVPALVVLDLEDLNRVTTSIQKLHQDVGVVSEA